MAGEKKENGQGTEKVKPLSLFEERMRGLLDELDGHMAQVGEDYGPILMEVLQNRLELIIKNFDNDSENILKQIVDAVDQQNETAFIQLSNLYLKQEKIKNSV